MDWSETDPYISNLEDIIYLDTTNLEKSNIVPIWIILAAITLGYKWTSEAKDTTAENILESIIYYSEVTEQFYA